MMSLQMNRQAACHPSRRAARAVLNLARLIRRDHRLTCTPEPKFWML
jgi:hypothetical protein